MITETTNINSKKSRMSIEQNLLPISSKNTNEVIASNCSLPNKLSSIDFSKTVLPKQRKQKALKQTNIKNLNSNSKYVKRRLTGSLNSYSDLYLAAPRSPEFITTILAGNVKFNSNKNQFKCVECGDTDLKSHFKYYFFVFFI